MSEEPTSADVAVASRGGQRAHRRADHLPPRDLSGSRMRLWRLTKGFRLPSSPFDADQAIVACREAL